MYQILLTARLRPDSRQAVLQVLQEGPPFDLQSTSPERHMVFVGDDEVIFLVAGRRAEQGARLTAAQGLEVQTQAVQADGNAWGALLDTAHEHRAAAVVVGSRGISAFESALLGSVSRARVHHAPAPVLVVRPPKR